MKMKQLIYLVSLVLFCACQNTEDLLDNDNGSDGQSAAVTVDFTLPDGLQSRAATRAYGDGLTVERIHWAVYKSSGANNSPGALVKDSIVALPSGQSVLSGKFIIDKLPIGETLDFVFWADNSKSRYEFNVSSGTVSMNYESATCNDENRDAFFRSERNVTITKGLDLSVVLRRPFAQLNILTDDLPVGDENKYSVELGSGSFYDKLNLLTGHAESNAGAQTVTFRAAKASTETMVIGEKTYSVVSMNYLLVDGDQDDHANDNSKLHLVKFLKNDISLLGVNGNGLTDVPFRRNYRTNIYGSLLTTDGSANYLIVPNFYEPDLGVETLITNETELKNFLSQARDMSVETTILLSSNIELTEPLDIGISGKIKIDLRGNTLSASIDAVVNGRFNDKPVITLNNKDAILTITDSSTPTDGNYGNIGNGYADYAIGVEQGTLIMDGADCHGKYGCVKWLKKSDDQGTYTETSSPRVSILKGTFSAAEMKDGVYRLLDFDLQVPSGVKNWTNNNVRNFIVYGGEFKNYDPSNAVVNGHGSWNFLPSKRSGQSVADNKASGNTIEDNDQADYTSTLDESTQRYKVTKTETAN